MTKVVQSKSCNTIMSLADTIKSLMVCIVGQVACFSLQDFKRQSSLFFKIISSIKSHHSSPHLAQLLLRVDYNKYFSTQNPLVSTTLGSLSTQLLVLLSVVHIPTPPKPCCSDHCILALIASVPEVHTCSYKFIFQGCIRNAEHYRKVCRMAQAGNNSQTTHKRL